MKAYLEKFFKEFEYNECDARVLLDAYEKISTTPNAKDLLSTLLTIYESNGIKSWREDVLETRSSKIAEITQIHPYTVDLVVTICLTRHLKELYKSRGISDEIYHDTVLDLKWKLEECKLVKGVIGSFVAFWFGGFFDLTRFALGRLQFEVINFGASYNKNGRVLTPSDKVINVHIPRTGTPIDKESCDKSYALAREFFKRNAGENAPFVCSSWLLDPEHFSILDKKSNIYRFISEYDVFESGVTDGKDLWRLFDTDERDPDKLPRDSSLRRIYIKRIQEGKPLGRGRGVKF